MCLRLKYMPLLSLICQFLFYHPQCFSFPVLSSVIQGSWELLWYLVLLVYKSQINYIFLYLYFYFLISEKWELLTHTCILLLWLFPVEITPGCAQKSFLALWWEVTPGSAQGPICSTGNRPEIDYVEVTHYFIFPVLICFF